MSLLKNSPIVRSEALIENQARWAIPSELTDLSRAFTDLLEEKWRCVVPGEDSPAPLRLPQGYRRFCKTS